ncbi:hypothetical protein Tco_1416953 [Tanacetum coccineum]
MKEYDDVFAVPTDLPPKRGHDDKIPLVEGAKTVNIRLYRHPPTQKDAIGEMVAELLEVGVIKKSNNPFSSPIVMAVEDHELHLRTILAVLRQHKFYAKKSKCVFRTNKVEYLAHVISIMGMATDLEKVKAMSQWPMPTNVKHVRGFLVLTGYYKRFIEGYANIIKPLTQLLKKNGLAWTEE